MDYSPEGDTYNEFIDMRENESKANLLHNIEGEISPSHV